MQSCGFIFGDPDHGRFYVELANTGHSVTEYLSFEASLVLKRNVAEFGTPDRETSRCMSANRISKFPLVRATKFRRTDNRNCICSPETGVLTACCYCCVDDLTGYSMPYKHHPAIMSSDAMPTVSHSANF